MLLYAAALLALIVFTVNISIDSTATVKRFLASITNSACRDWILAEGIDPDEVMADGYSAKTFHLGMISPYLTLDENEVG